MILDNSAILAFGGNDSGDLNGASAWDFPAAFNKQWDGATGLTPLLLDRSAGAGIRLLAPANTATGTTTMSNQTGYSSNVAWGAITIAIAPAIRSPRQEYAYLGAKQRHADTEPGIIEMGARLYNPNTGRFLQTDPVYGGSANAYDYTNQDPTNQLDLDGQLSLKGLGLHLVDFTRLLRKRETRRTVTFLWKSVRRVSTAQLKGVLWASRRINRFIRWVSDLDEQSIHALGSILCDTLSEALSERYGEMLACEMGAAHNNYYGGPGSH